MEDRDQREYPEKKRRELDEDENDSIRSRIEQGKSSREIADEFDCSLSQVAGIKAAMNRR
jgi:DNA invertase Pin-like site-specific DNA recombinase